MSTKDSLHKKRIIQRLKDRRALLEEQRAIKGISTEPHIITEIEDLDQQIGELEKAGESDVMYHLSALALPLQKYDLLVKQLADTLPSQEDDQHKFRLAMLPSLTTSLNAASSFIARDTGADWDIVVKHTSTRKDTKEQHLQQDIQNLLHKVGRIQQNQNKGDRNKYNTIMIATNPISGERLLFALLPDMNPTEILVITDIQVDYELDTGIGAVLTTILEITRSITYPSSSIAIQMSVLNTLRREFSYVSDFMYSKQFSLFKQSLEQVVMFFEPIISLSYYPYICRWEALARDPATGRAPIDLFKTAELWGRAFQVELDMYCLQKAVESYRILPNRPSNNHRSSNDSGQRGASQAGRTEPANYRTRVGDLLPLSVNVYPDTLMRRVYRETIVNLAKDKIIPLDKLTLELSEKAPLPLPEDISPGQDHIDWFREKLTFYTRLGITFAIDDYGIGFASASRLSRLEPSIVKIDRDALLHAQGSYTIQHVLKLEQDSLGKMQVIVEGFDDESKFSLVDLYKLGIRYVQGHAIGFAVPAKDMYRLSTEQEEEITRKLLYI